MFKKNLTLHFVIDNFSVSTVPVNFELAFVEPKMQSMS